MNRNISHKALENIVVNKKNFFIDLISTMLEKNIKDILITPKFNFNNQEIDFLVLTDLGDIVLFELKTLNDINNLDLALAQLNRYTNSLFNVSSEYILLKVKEKNIEYGNFINDNSLTGDVLEDYINANLMTSKVLNFIIIPDFSKDFSKRFNDLTKGNENIILINVNEKTDLKNTSFCYRKVSSNGKGIMNNDFRKVENYLNYKLIEPLLKQIENLNLLYDKLVVDTQIKDNLLEKFIEISNKNDNSNNDDKEVKNTEAISKFDLDKTVIIPKTNITIGELLETIKGEYLKYNKITICEFTKKLDKKKLDKRIPSKYFLMNIFNMSIGKILVLSGIDPETIYSGKLNNREGKEKRYKRKRDEIANKIKDIYLKEGKISENILKKNGMHPNTIKYYFKTIQDAYEAANIKSSYKTHINLTKEETMQEYMKICIKLNQENKKITARNIKVEGLPYYFIIKYFGGLSELQEAVREKYYKIS